jgi:hypothetical protein
VVLHTEKLSELAAGTLTSVGEAVGVPVGSLVGAAVGSCQSEGGDELDNHHQFIDDDMSLGVYRRRAPIYRCIRHAASSSMWRDDPTHVRGRRGR